MNDLYEFTVEWPSTTAQSVIVTGDFDKWSRSLQLSRSAKDTFTATIKVPYGCPTRYKFIVDGEWTVKPDQPTEWSPEGYLNNIHYVPLKALPAVKPSTDVKTGDASVTLGQSLGITDLKDTIVATAGTSGALAYVTSGFGETVRSVVGVDPFSSNQIAIPTPITPSTNIGFPPIMSASDDTTTPNMQPAVPVVNSTGSASVAPLVPIGIVPVYAKENCTIDPSKVIGDEENIGVFVGVRPISKNYVQETVNKEEGKDTEVNQEVPVSPSSSALIGVTGPPAPAKEAAKAEVSKEENAVVETAVHVTEADPEPVPAAVSFPAEKEKAPSPEEPSKNVDETTTPILTSGTVPEISAQSTTNEHVQDPSFTSTKVAPPSRPTTPTGTSAPAESVTPTPISTVRKSKIFPLGKGSLSKTSTKDGSTDEFDVQDGKDTIRKKRKSSIFRSLKKLFHHERHEKEKGQEENH